MRNYQSEFESEFEAEFDIELEFESEFESVHLTLLPHICSVQVKSRSMLHHGSVGGNFKKNKRNLKRPNPNPNP